MFRNTASGFGHVAIILHWTIALLVFIMLALGNIMGALASTDPQRAILLDLHKMIGLTILALVVLRIAWRLANPVPASDFDAGMAADLRAAVPLHPLCADRPHSADRLGTGLSAGANAQADAFRYAAGACPAGSGIF